MYISKYITLQRTVFIANCLGISGQIHRRVPIQDFFLTEICILSKSTIFIKEIHEFNFTTS